MAKGKEAAKSERRRNEAAIEHIDRLTEQLLDARERARRYEAAALRLPSVEGELGRLRQQVEEGTSDTLEKERSARREQVADLEHCIDRLSFMVNRCLDMLDKHDEGLTMEEYAEMERLTGRAHRTAEASPNVSRAIRRHKTKPGDMGNATDEGLRAVGMRRVGERLKFIDPKDHQKFLEEKAEHEKVLAADPEPR